MRNRCRDKEELRSVNLNRYVAKQLGNPTGLAGKGIALVMNRQNRPLYEETIRLLSPSDTGHILDIGCGNGYVLGLLARRCGGVLTGIDTSQSMIRSAARRNRAYVKSQRMTLARQDAGAMSFADGTFDKAYSINTVYFWDDLQGTMAEIRRVLKPGGLFINTCYSNETLSRLSHTQFGYRRYTAEQLTSAGTDAGFTVKVASILHGAAHCFVYRAD